MVSQTQLLLLLLFTSVSVSTSSSAQIHVSHNISSSSCKLDLQPPFAYHGARNGFKVICKQGKSFLHLPSYAYDSYEYELKDINVGEGYVIISTAPILTICPNDTTHIGNDWFPDDQGKIYKLASGWIDLQGSLYSLSSRNKFTLIGCNTVVITWGQTTTSNISESSGCVVYCDSFFPVVDCSGFGCCQSDIISTNTELYFGTISSATDNFSSYNGCSQAFFVDQHSFQFNESILNHTYFGNETYHDVVLEWAIENKTCKEARKNTTAYACKSNSYCYESPAVVGYRCNCSRGYNGNPYQKGGCKDINECDDPSLNPCVGLCINTPGNVTCRCPKGKKGDGRKQGKGCERVNHLELALGVGFSTLFMLIFGSLWSYWFVKKRELMKLRTKFFRQNGGLLLQQQISSQGNETMKIFSVEELRNATGNFNESHILGQGGYGTVYKGVLPDHRIVAIKKSRLMDDSQVEQFVNEIVILSQINHRNVVRLLGCCLETQVPLLVYEFISNGSLFELIHSKNHTYSLSWDVRLQIASDTAGALAYLHSAASIPIIHRDVKSANILLDESYTAKVSDFGASRSVPFDQTHVTTLVQGTLGYLDPEYFRTSLLTEKSDVYSFGVVLAELMTGEMPVSFSRTEILRNLASYFIVLLEENKLLKVMEGEMLVEAGIEQIFSVAELVRKCLSLKGEERPTMKEVAMELEGLRKFRMQQTIDQHKQKEGEEECLLRGAGPSNSNNIEVEMSRLFTSENHMLLSANSPR